MSEFGEDPPVDLILEAIDGELYGPKQPKVILFDIGGVCVVSPFQAILDYELSLGIPPGWINHSISKSAPNGFWHRLERGDIAMDEAFFEGFNRDLHRQSLWEAFYERERAKNPKLDDQIPPLPALDGEWLFNAMMSGSVKHDPWMFPALQALKAKNKYIIGALSNTVIFPPGHALHQADFFSGPLKGLFDVFVSSAHVGHRKPEPSIYQLATKRLDEFAKGNADSPRNSNLGWESGVKATEILFLDDIGENLKAAKKEGFNTIKVNLGRTFEAVEELEKITGLELEGDHPKIPVKPRFTRVKTSKI
ncbi:HAD-like domain [Cordyceps militaris]|uniref:HAD-like domain n=1 Tax=Cordyceps militaris TaxID=73501 RepID=A0A2H4SSK7_CORMI|nr:HAD-like domain [Cordyceps militaris]